MQDKNSNSDIENLHKKAIALLKSEGKSLFQIDSEDDKLKLIHDLEVHQLELELQNEELQKAKSAALHAVEKYKELYDFAPTGYFTLSKEGEIIGLNLSGSDLLCKTRSKLLNSQFGFFVTNDTKPTFNEFLKKALASKVNVTCEVSLNTVDHKPIQVFISGISTENGEQCLINVMDITQNKMAQELIALNKELSAQIREKEILTAKLTKAKNKAEESDRQKTAFLSNMSHEIRTPLNGILGFSQLLKAYEKLDPRQEKFVNMIEQGGMRLLSIVSNLIEISKIESGLSKVMISSCNVNDLIEYTYNLFKPESETKRIKISFKVSLPEKEAYISTDREKIYAILSNLVKNSIKFSDEGKIEFGYLLRDRPDNRIDVSDTSIGQPTTMTSKSQWSDSPELLFFVKDTGIGILPENIDSLFSRFDKVSKRDTKTSKGSGLGLSIAKAYTEMLGGQLWVESKPGKGSTFYFTIPYNYVPKELIAKSNVLLENLPESKIKKLKILIVEDDEPSALLSTEIFQKFCRVVLYATNGAEAVDVFKNNPDIDLVLMDINMPVMNGCQATKKIREINKEVVIIAQSAHVFESDREKALEAGCNAFLLKPVDRHQLFGLLISYFGV